MKFSIRTKHLEGYLPTPRHRKLRWREAKAEIDVEVSEVSSTDAPIAFKVSKYEREYVDYRFWEDKLWIPKTERDGEAGVSVPMLLECLPNYIRNYGPAMSLDETRKSLQEKAKEYLIVDEAVYEAIGEPRYVVRTFGLGHNHGGTSLCVENHYNTNISKERYFSALDRDAAIADARWVAMARGDTKSIEYIGKWCDIKVLIPEAAKCSPSLEHGDGDSFMNKLEAIAQASPDADTAGIISMLCTASEINK